jgi:hypothetical protein
MAFHESPDNWQPPDGLGYSSLRPVCLTRQGYALAAVGVILGVGALTLSVFLINKSKAQAAARDQLRSQGTETVATVTRLWRTGDKEETRMVAYRFTAGGREIDGKSSAPSAIWRGLTTDAPLAVRFVPGRPEINHPAGWESSVLPIWLPFFAGGCLLFAPVTFAVMIRKQTRLLSEGRPAPGVVTGIKRSDKAVFVLYEFKLLSGAVMKGRSNGGRRSPGVGSPVCVLYDPDNPRRNAIYPLGLVKLMRS